MRKYIRAEHAIIVEALAAMRADFMLDNLCWFGGGTAIVLKLDEYRRSADVDFLCGDRDGYRELRQAAQTDGIAAFFDGPVMPLREVRTDQYGIRTVLEFRGQVIKFEIVREARIELTGEMDSELRIPLLSREDMFAEKLLANADRCMDRSVAYRDAIDIGMLAFMHGGIPQASLTKAERAYGDDIERKLVWSAARLQVISEHRYAAQSLQMSEEDADRAVAALNEECRRRWPDQLNAATNANGLG